MELRGIEVCVEALQRPESTVPERAAAIALDVLNAFRRVANTIEAIGLDPDDPLISGFEAWSADGASALRDLLLQRPVEEVSILRWSVKAMSNITNWVADAADQLNVHPRLYPDAPAVDGEALDVLRRELAAQAGQVKVEVDAILINLEAAELVKETREARDAAQSAAGQTANASLGIFFNRYSKQEGLASNTFRIFTIVTVLTGAAFIVFLPAADVLTVASVSTRVAIAGAAAALSTYFARQAGQHRRLTTGRAPRKCS